MSNLELGDFVAAEIERNPILTDEARPEPGEVEAPPPPPAAAGPEAADRRVTAEGDHALAGETFDAGQENLYDTARADGPPADRTASAPRQGTPIAAGVEAPDLENRLGALPTLGDVLTAQIGQMRADGATAALACALVGELEDDGYLRAEPAELCARLDCTTEALAAAVALVQRCEPTGVGARGLGECFALQLAERDRLDPAMQALIDRLDLVARGDLARLRRQCGVDAEDLADMLAELRGLDPRPGAAFAAEEARTVVPDIFVTRASGGGWRIELNPDTLPRVLIDHAYVAELSAGGDEARAFLHSCRETANWLVRSLDQRARTIVRVTSEIVTQQDAFFREGAAGLRPLSLRMVADAIGMHESTVSRVTSNKYLATDRGIFELKYFFTNAVGGREGPAAEAVRHRIRAMVAAEDPTDVLSDDQIVDTLAADGIEVARRTVAKYRKSLGIPSSVARRRAHALRAAE